MLSAHSYSNIERNHCLNNLRKGTSSLNAIIHATEENLKGND